MKAKHENVYQQLLNEVKENQDNFNLVTKNEEIHNKQFDYLLKRYLLNIERENDISMRQFRELDLVLHHSPRITRKNLESITNYE